MFRSWQRGGKLTPQADPEQLAALLATVVRGLAVLGRSSSDPAPIGRAVDGAVQAFAPFLKPRNSQPRSNRCRMSVWR